MEEILTERSAAGTWEVCRLRGEECILNFRVAYKLYLSTLDFGNGASSANKLFKAAPLMVFFRPAKPRAVL